MHKGPDGELLLAPDDTVAAFEIYIRATPERVWEALTEPEQRARYLFGWQTETDWEEGSSYRWSVPGGIDVASGENLEVDPPRRLVHTLTLLFDDAVKSEGTTRVTWEIEPVGDDSCRVSVVHDQMRPERNNGVYGGWPQVLSGLKTLVETGEGLTTPGSLHW